MRDKEGKPPRSSSSVAQRLVVKTKRVARRSRSQCTTRMQPLRCCGDGHPPPPRQARMQAIAEVRPRPTTAMGVVGHRRRQSWEEVTIGRLRQFSYRFS